MDRDWTASFLIQFRIVICIIILDETYNIANSSCHFGSYEPVRHPKNIIWTSEASVHIIFFGWRTCPYTAIWPSVPWTICSYHFAYSPIWGYFNTLTARFRNESIPLDTVYSKIECEKLHIKFCKRVLGVHQKSTNSSVISELGRFPVHYQII